jgi:hypothetical protein
MSSTILMRWWSVAALPGQLVLLGADNGEWTVDVTDADGLPLTYKVDIHSIVNFSDPTKPGKAPAALNNPLGANAEVSATAALDPGAGPVDAANLTTTTKVAAVEAPGIVKTEATTDPIASSPGPAGTMTAPTSRPSNTAVAAVTVASGMTPTFLGSAPPASPGAAAHISPVKLAEYIAPPSTAPPALAGSNSGLLIPSQAASSLPTAPQRFKANPQAIPSSPSEAGPSRSNFLPDDVVIVMSGASRVFDFPGGFDASHWPILRLPTFR